MPIEQTLEEVERDITSGNYGKARDGLHGLIATYPDDLALREKLGDIYWKLEYPAMAGRYWYLERDKSQTMVAACQAFEQSCGNDPFQILLALKYRGDVESIRDTHAGRTLLELHEEAKKKHPYYSHFQKPGAAKYTGSGRLGRDRELPVACCIVGLLVALGLMVVGLWTVLTWVF
jgi:hypothetical protein